MEEPLFRKKNLDRISSPEQLDEYLRVTSPVLWLLLAAVILLLAGMLFWASRTSVESYVNGTGTVENGSMTIRFDDVIAAQNVKEGMEVTTGTTTTVVRSIGRTDDGTLFAVADCELADGDYSVRVRYRTTQVLKILFN